MPNSAGTPKGGTVDFDVLIVGAGISGINAAYRIQTEAPAGTSYAVFEARDQLGGTWDLFRYPGIRSDSDMFTFAFQWNPWYKKETMAQGYEIREYLASSVKMAGIDSHIRFGHSIISANWVSNEKCWEVVAQPKGQDKPSVFRSRFILLGTGYYSYESPMKTVIPGIENFKGKVMHPQFWPEDYDYTDQNIVIIGSGATAISIVPAMAGVAKHVTMLQRSPTYIFPVPLYSKITALLFVLFPRALAYRINRAIWILITYWMIVFCNRHPGIARSAIRRVNKALLPPDVPIDPHFTPSYNPWEQRLCASLDGDIFAALRAGQASVVTDTIEMVTENSIRLKSGQVLHPDAIITATGLQVMFGGGIQIFKDGKRFDDTKKFIWRACMVQDLPNMIFTVGFENASWTLGADCAAILLARLMRDLKSKDASVAMPYLEEPEKMEEQPLLTLKATYLKNVNDKLPKAGTGVWSPRSNYMKDLYIATRGDIHTGLVIELGAKLVVINAAARKEFQDSTASAWNIRSSSKAMESQKCLPSMRWTSFEGWDYDGMKERLQTALEAINKPALIRHAERVKGQKVFMSTPFSAGQYWICFEMVAVDHTLIIARVRLPRRAASSATVSVEDEAYAMICEVETMKFVRLKVPSIPIPAVYACALPGSELATAAGAAYMLLEGFHGNTLQDVGGNLCNLEARTQEHIMSQWTWMQGQLATITSPKIGSIYSISDGGEPMAGRLVDYVSMGLAETGPFSTARAYFSAVADTAVHRSSQDAQAGAKAFRDIVLRTDLFGNPRTKERFPLSHMDLGPQNVLVDSDFNFVAIIDWEFAQFAPWQTYHYPMPFPLLGLDTDDILQDPSHLAFKNVLPQSISQALYCKGFKQVESELGELGRPIDAKLSDILNSQASRIYACFSHLGRLPVADASLAREMARLAFGLQGEDAEEYIRQLGTDRD